jgi:S2P endopeptidase
MKRVLYRNFKLTKIEFPGWIIALIDYTAILLLFVDWRLPQRYSISTLTTTIPKIVLILTVMLVSGLLHELGHFMQSFKYKVRVYQAGLCLYYVFPGFYITLDTVGLKKLSASKQIMVYFGGMLMNLRLSAASVILLQCLPYLSYPLYSIDTSKVLILSSLHDFPKGFVINKINGNQITTGLEDYKQLLLHKTPFSRCMSSLEVNASRMYDCCNSNHISKSHQLELDCVWDTFSVQKYYSLTEDYKIVPSRCFLTNITEFITNSPPCVETDCAQDKSCMSVATFNDKKRYILFNLIHHSSDEKRDVLFIGDPNLLFQNLQVGILIPKYRIIPILIPLWVEITLLYFYTMNIGNVMLNILPLPGLDGDLIVEVLLGPSLYLKSSITVALLSLYYYTLL